jgi:rfaE bifunctional protein kinase chain/domain
VRVLAGGTHSTRQQVIRIDYDETTHTADAQQRLLAELHARTTGVDACIVSDYNYGVASDAVIENLRRHKAHTGKPVLVDSRFRLAAFAGFTAATPNEDEVEGWRGSRLDDAGDLEAASVALHRELSLQALLVTRGSQGMLLIESGHAPQSLAIVGAHDAVDVTGAGDTVIATYTLALASNSTHTEAARLANHAGGIVVMKRGTAAATADELIASLHRHQR